MKPREMLKRAAVDDATPVPKMTRRDPIAAVQGTWGWKGGWWEDDSPLWQFFAPYGFVPARLYFDGDNDAEAFEWSTDLGNSFKFWTWGRDFRRRHWLYAGRAFAYFISQFPYEQRNILAHSHGGQVAAAGIARGVRVRRLMMLGTPNRADMFDIYDQARPLVERWCHVFDADEDDVALGGQIGDGQLFGGRKITQAHDAKPLVGIGHSGLLSDPSLFHHWINDGLLDFFSPATATDHAA